MKHTEMQGLVESLRCCSCTAAQAAIAALERMEKETLYWHDQAVALRAEIQELEIKLDKALSFG